MPLVSVIIPVYRTESYLRECIDSVLNQTFKDFELILVDDGSPDNCPAICDEYAMKDNRVVVIHRKNGGLFSARNAGLEYVCNHSNAQYVTFVDSDDYIDKSYLDILIRPFKNDNVAISYCSCYRFGFYDNLNKKIIYYNYYKEPGVYLGLEHLKKMITNKIGCHVCFAIFKKDLLNELQFPSYSFLEDELFHIKALEKAHLIYFNPIPLYYYRVNPDSLTKTGTTDEKKKFYRVISALDKINFIKTNNNLSDVSTEPLYEQLSINIFSFLIKDKFSYPYEYKQLKEIAKQNKLPILLFRHKLSRKKRFIIILFYYLPFIFCISSSFFSRKCKIK